MLLKKTKKIMSIVLSMLFMVSILPAIPAFAADEGSCGVGVTYSFNQSTGTLTISGHGKMNDYSPNDAPWNSYKNSIKNLTIENGVTSIGKYAFYGCIGLTGPLTIPDSVTDIGSSALEYCSGLKYIAIPDSVTDIGCSAFNGCGGLIGSLTISNRVTFIGYMAFDGCSGLEAINVDESNTKYKSIEGILFSKDGKQLIKYPEGKKNTCYTVQSSVKEICCNAFDWCSGLEAINVVKSNKNYKSIDGILFSKDGTQLIKCPAGKKATCYTIPSSVTKIVFCAFEGCSGLEAITIPSSVTKIGFAAFAYCSRLTGPLTIPSSVAKIEDNTFKGCSGLSSVTIENGVTEIGFRAFYGCSGLTSVTILSDVKVIRTEAFMNCINLTSLNYLGNAEPNKGLYWDFSFLGCSNLSSVKVPAYYKSDKFCDIPVVKDYPCDVQNVTDSENGSDQKEDKQKRAGSPIYGCTSKKMRFSGEK